MFVRNLKFIAFSLSLVGTVLSFGLQDPVWAAPLDRPRMVTQPPVWIRDHTFNSEDWTVSAQATSGATYTVTQQLDGGFGGGEFRFISHRLPPVQGNDLSNVTLNHIYLGESYSPADQGPITSVDYLEAGIILSFPFPEAFSTTQPLVAQGGRLFRSMRFIRFIAQDSIHYWETKALNGLTASDFVAVDDSGDHPDFSSSGGPIQFGFTRNNSRSSTSPPVPGDQDMVIDQGVDLWEITIYGNPPPVDAVDDVYIFDGNRVRLPIDRLLDVTSNDSGQSLGVIDVTQPSYGSVSFGGGSVSYSLNEATGSDDFSYSIGDGTTTDSAVVNIYIDCACSVLCLTSYVLPQSHSPSLQAQDNLDLPLIYRVRDYILKPTVAGRQYIDMYYESNPEILVNILANEPLRSEALATVELWQDNLRSLTAGDGNAVITQAQMDAIASFLDHLSSVSSADLQQLIASELQRLGPLDEYAGLTVKQAKSRAIGEATIFLPMALP